LGRPLVRFRFISFGASDHRLHFLGAYDKTGLLHYGIWLRVFAILSRRQLRLAHLCNVFGEFLFIVVGKFLNKTVGKTKADSIASGSPYLANNWAVLGKLPRKKRSGQACLVRLC
jgi:hypothetical protein